MSDAPPLAVSIERLAELIGTSRATAYKLISSGEIESFTIGKRRLATLEAAQRYIAKRLAESPKPTEVPNLRRDAKRAAD